MPIDPAYDPMVLTQMLVDWLTSTQGQSTEPDEEPRTEIPSEPSTEPEPELDLGIEQVSAWAGTGSLADPKAYVAFAKGLGLKRLDVIVNDHAAWRSPMDFDTYSIPKLERLCAEVTAAGIELHFMSWLMPHRRYIDGAERILRPLVERTGARSIVWDCEEPWTQAKSAMPYSAAATAVAEAFDGITQGVTGIGYAPVAKLAPIGAASHYLVPQCYSTTSSGQSPSTVVVRFAARWRKVFPGKPLAIGLAAYRQSGIPGYSAESALRAAFGGAEADPGAKVAIYWSLAQIKSSPTVANTIARMIRGR